MKLSIRHRTLYRYSRPVWLDPHWLRVRPRSDGCQRLVSQTIHFDPAPAERRCFVDAWGNSIDRLGFEGPTDRFDVDVSLEVETGEPRPPEVEAVLPLDYGDEAPALAPYLARAGPEAEVAAFVRDLAGAARSPAETLRRGEGVCRDLAVPFLACCRELGIAARFVSGYQEGSAHGGDGRRYLHAWAEAYLPGAGWHGFDPTHGTAVGDDRVAIASAASPAGVAPIEGSYRFAGAPPSRRLDTELTIRRTG